MNQVDFLEEFQNVSKGVSKYIKLDVLQVGVPYQVKQFRTQDSPYGKCLIADLVTGFWLFLPKRIANLVNTDEQLELINGKGYWLIFNGRDEQYRNMALVEFKTMEQIAVDNINSEMIVTEVVGTMGDIFTQDFPLHQFLDPVNENKQVGEGRMKSGAAPKVSIKVKKDRK